MSTLRFTLLVVGLFALAFVGVSWGTKGFPIVAIRVAPLKPDARIPTFDESVQKGLRKDWENSKTLQSDGDRERDRLRLELLQASTAYEMSPCDDTMKKNLVAALANYTRGWRAMAFCTPGAAGCPKSDNDRLDIAAAAFKTPADVNVHNALRKALERGGIWREDFPIALRHDVFMWTGMPLAGPKLSCMIAREEKARQ